MKLLAAIIGLAASIFGTFAIAYVWHEVLPDGWLDEWYGVPMLGVLSLGSVASLFGMAASFGTAGLWLAERERK